MNKLALYAIVISAFFPYVSFVELPMDTSPYFIVCVISMSFFLLVRLDKSISIPKPDLLIILFLIYFVGLLLIRLVVFVDMDSFRVLGNYASLMFAIVFFSSIVRSVHGMQDDLIEIVSKLILITSFLYLSGSMLQLATRLTGIDLFTSIVDALIGRGGRTTDSRGFNSLTAEPSYAGIMCSVLGVIALDLYRQGYLNARQVKFVTFNFLATTLLSAAATAFPFLILYMFYIAKLFKLKLLAILTAVLTLIALTILFSTMQITIENARIFALFSNPSGILDDVSALSRFGSIVNYSLPLLSGQNWTGFALSDISPQLLSEIIDQSGVSSDFAELLKIGLYGEGGGLRTKSVVAQTLFLFGFVSLLFWALFLWRLRKKLMEFNQSSVLTSMIFLGYLIQVPLGHPLFLLAIGLILMQESVSRKQHFTQYHLYKQEHEHVC